MDLSRLRKKVNAIDDRILALLNQRARCSQTIGRYKRDRNELVYAPDREAEVLARLVHANSGPVRAEDVLAIYREIMSSSIGLERRIAIAYLGPELTFTHQAGVKKFGSSVGYIPCTDISDVFREVEHERCEYGVVPVENSIEGAITHTLDRFVDSDLKICSEIILRVSLSLMSRERSLKSVRGIYSNPQVFGQCRHWLESHALGMELKNTTSTARGAEIALKEKHAACIASPLAARLKGLKVLAESIEDQHNNATRFLVIARESARPTRRDKTSILFSLKDRVGALHRSLEPFRKHGINLTKIESRPSKTRRWEYYFFVDFEGHAEEPRVRRALRELERECIFTKTLGSYPRAREQ